MTLLPIHPIICSPVQKRRPPMKRLRYYFSICLAVLACLTLLPSCGGASAPSVTSRSPATQATTSAIPSTTAPPPVTTTAPPATTGQPTTTSQPPATTAQPTTTTTRPPAAGVEIIIEGYAFKPNSISIKAGTRVTWRNMDSVDHTASSDVPGQFSTFVAGSGGTSYLVFDTPGVFYYHCEPHPEMRASITVTP